ncbi:MAG: PD40 domain-containing protein [Flavipsychrobacter sp.]|nr:PD40 domain-containing protein [Flavipsychrobacter sp.]
MFLPNLLLLGMFLSEPMVSQQLLDTQINTTGYERDLAISPDGREVFFTRQGTDWKEQTIWQLTKQADGSWSGAKPAPFSGVYRDLEPFFAPDGKRLYFASARPKPDREGTDVDIWMVERLAGGWSEPIHLGPAINSEKDEYYPSVTREGHLYFTSEREGGPGKEDIYRAEYFNGSWLTARPLDTGVNSAYYEFNAYVSPDESLLIFTSYGRSDDTGRGDLYFSKKNTDGSWSPATNLKAANSTDLDYCPFVSPDGKTLYYTSEKAGKKNGNIYMLPPRP